MTKPTIPQGTRDFGPETVRKRQFIFDTIRNVFELYGFQPLETPAMENLETLTGKYGEEGDKLIFKILNNGLSDPKNRDKAKTAFEQVLDGRNEKAITERALRYDLTIPFARYVAMNHGQLTLPFKRYQVQPVWRADRPQKGRYREFYQCDADVVGSDSLVNEVELASIYHEVFNRLAMPGYELRINNRKILQALAELCGGHEKMMAITVAIDKLDKIGLEKVKEELTERGLDQAQISTVENYLSITGTNEEKMAALRKLVLNNETAIAGLKELEFVLNYPGRNNSKQQFVIDLTLARGLNYYTGIIFEVRAPAEVSIGSIGGGGRYDDLTGLFGVPGIAGVGISFGVDRIFDVMEELKLFPDVLNRSTEVLFFNLGMDESKRAYIIMQELRAAGIRSELFHENAKFDKQFKYAERKKIDYVVIIGGNELAAGNCTIKQLSTGKQETVQQDVVSKWFAEHRE